jgi:cell division cycle 20-like protein 1 (cofactor of APC complex)
LDALDAGLVREASPRGAHGHGNGSAASNIDNIQSHQSSSSGGNNNNNSSSYNQPGTDRDDSAHVYNTLLKHELLALDTSDAAYASPGDKNASSTNFSLAMGSPSKKALHFRTGRDFFQQQQRLESPFSTSILGNAASVAGLPFTRRSTRRIARSPFKVLDAPALADDFYLNLVDWSSQNILAVGLGACVYLWSASTSKVTTLCDLGPQDCVCSVNWTQRGTYLAVGTNQGEVQIWDVTKSRCIRTVEGHRSRVGTLAWNSHTLSSGSRDRNILQHDVRSPEHYNSRLVGHRSEVCGLKWSPDGRELASGGNDNQLFIWNSSSLSPRLRFVEHTAAVKAIAWSPHQHGLLASGGGTADRCIRFWNTSTNTALHAVDTGSQVCNLMWSKNVNELVSTHGYSQNQIIAWRYPSLTKLTTLTGHTLRVLYLAMSPDGQTIVTGAGDETLRFWNVFPSQRLQGNEDSSAWSSIHSCIR